MRTCSIPPTPEHEAAARRVLERGVLTEGPETDALEEDFALWLRGTLLDPRRVVAVSSGTSALAALLVAQGVGPGDEVVVPAVTFTATALAVLRAGARPVFADVNSTWSLSPQSLEEVLSDDVRAVIGVDLYGVPADWKAIERVVPKDVLLVEDACPAYGARYGLTPAGLLGRNGAAFSLNESKQLPAGEGGLVVAPSVEVAEVIRALRNFGERPKDRRPFGLRRSVLAGDNWKITEMSAALARAGMPTLLERVMASRLNASFVHGATNSSPAFARSGWTANAEPSWFTLPVKVRDPGATARIADWLARRGVPIRDGEVAPLYEHPVFRDARRGSCPNSREIARTFCIGSREEPIFGVSSSDAERWAEVITSLPT